MHLRCGDAAALDDLFFLEHVEHGAHRGTRTRIPAEGVGAFAVTQGFDEVGAAHHSGRGLSVADAFAEDDQVGLHPVGFVRVHMAGAAVAGLHFVKDEGHAVLIAPRLQHLVIPAGRMEGAGGAEIRLGDQQ